MYDLMVIEVVG